MEIPPVKADLAQISKGRDGRLVEIENDVQNVANGLAEIDPHLRLRYSEAGEYFVVYWKPDGSDDGDGYLVTTAQELDQRIVHLVREIYWKAQQPGYSLAAEAQRIDDEAQKRRDDEFREAHGGMYERLAWALRKDTGHQGRIFVPELPHDSD